MASAIEAQRAGFSVALIDKGCLVNFTVSLSRRTWCSLPHRSCWRLATFLSRTANQKPNRQEALEYYRNVAQHYAWTCASTAGDECYRLRRRVHVHARNRHGDELEYVAQKNCGGHWLLRSAELPGHSGRRGTARCCTTTVSRIRILIRTC